MLTAHKNIPNKVNPKYATIKITFPILQIKLITITNPINNPIATPKCFTPYNFT
jgi:hypothetical protein